jgi:hypothetical protein
MLADFGRDLGHLLLGIELDLWQELSALCQLEIGYTPFHVAEGRKWPHSYLIFYLFRFDGHKMRPAANLHLEVERKFCSMLVDKMQLRLLRMLDTVTRPARFLRVC